MQFFTGNEALGSYVADAQGMDTPMAVGGRLCPWCPTKKRAAGGAVNWSPVLDLIARVNLTPLVVTMQ